MRLFEYIKNPSQDQTMALETLENFFQSPCQVFLLKGYAGTGKTTILKGLATYLQDQGKEFVLMAPTGRAAKILRTKTGFGSTIHRGIYNFNRLESINPDSKDEANHSFHFYFPIHEADGVERIVIVDESSMISSKISDHELFTFGTKVLLDDLMTYASLKTTKNKIVFVGDPAQLPPFGDSKSMALDREYFESLDLQVNEVEMTQVLRQGDNLILKNAETLREVINSPQRSELKFKYDNTSFILTETDQIIDRYVSSFPAPDVGDGVIISYSNSQCYHYNMAIRDRLFPDQRDIVPGDLILINYNNYHTYSTELYNGEIAKVVEVSSGTVSQSAPVYIDEGGHKVRKIIDINFRSITIRIPDHPDDIKCLIIDSYLQSVDRDLSIHEMKALYINFVMRFNEKQKLNVSRGEAAHKVGSEDFKRELKSDPYFNALRVKFGYAITCHKAQGGEWDRVFVDYYGRVSLKTDPLRWCYTATTRGVNTVFAVSPPNFGRLDHLTFTPIGQIGTIPNDALSLERIPISPFHSEGQHKCKSLKYWNLLEKFEKTSTRIEKVQSFGDYLERYTLITDAGTIETQANHNGAGFFLEKFKVPDTVGRALKKELEDILNQEMVYDFNLTYSPSDEFLKEIHSLMQYECDKLGINITNVKNGSFFVTYYLKTDALCSYIQFYYNGQGRFTTAMPKVYNYQDDSKLSNLIQNLSNHVG